MDSLQIPKDSTQQIPTDSTHIQLPISVWVKVENFLLSMPFRQIEPIVIMLRNTIQGVNLSPTAKTDKVEKPNIHTV